MFINVVITRVILFCPAVPPSPPSAPSLVPRNATSFVSLLAKLLVLRARLSLSAHGRVKEREKRERERLCSVPLRECSFLSSSRPSSLPPFLSFSSFLSFPHRVVPRRSSRSHVAVFFSFSLPLSLSSHALRGVIAHGSLLLGLTHFPPLLLDGGASSSLRSPSRDSRIPRRPFLFLPPVPLFSRGWLLFHPSSRRSISPPHGRRHHRVRHRHRLHLSSLAAASRCSLLLPFPSSFFVPVDRGVLHSSNLNAGRAGVLYRLRK